MTEAPPKINLEMPDTIWIKSIRVEYDGIWVEGGDRPQHKDGVKYTRNIDPCGSALAEALKCIKLLRDAHCMPVDGAGSFVLRMCEATLVKIADMGEKV